MVPFSLITPQSTVFGRGSRTQAVDAISKLGRRVIVVRGRSVTWVGYLIDELTSSGIHVLEVYSNGEPRIDHLRDSLNSARAFRPDCIVAVGGGATIDLGKAISALVPSASDFMVHFEVIGKAEPIKPNPLPFVAIPTTSGTGAEATKNAVITIPEHGIKISLRDERMVPDLVIVDSELTDDAPKAVTLATGLDAIVQLIESYLCTKANPVTDALCRSTIPLTVQALVRLMKAEDPDARDTMAKGSYISGIALANSGLGIVHGLASVIGGLGGAHGAICGRLLPAALEVNQRLAAENGIDVSRFRDIGNWLGKELGGYESAGTSSLRQFIDINGLPTLEDLGCKPVIYNEISKRALVASSTKANPVALTVSNVIEILNKSN